MVGGEMLVFQDGLLADPTRLATERKRTGNTGVERINRRCCVCMLYRLRRNRNRILYSSALDH